MLTLNLTPKKIFGIILLLVGLIVISVTFVANRTGEVQSVSASIMLKLTVKGALISKKIRL